MQFESRLLLAGAPTDLSLLTPQLVADLSPGTDDTQGIDARTITSFKGDVVVNRLDSLGYAELVLIDSQSSTQTVLHRVDGVSVSTAITVLKELSGTLIFTADSVGAGVELWKTDGTAAGTTLITTLNGFSNRADPAVINGELFFLAADPITGTDLWKTDGTAAGTMLVRDFASIPTDFTVLGNSLFFTASDGVTGTELWKSDGTEAGTVLVKDIAPGTPGSGLSMLLNAGGRLFFAAREVDTGLELWTSDGTGPGTRMVTQIVAGSADGAIQSLTAVGSDVYFEADNGLNGVELWKSDGTAVGTAMVKDIRVGSTSTSIDNLTNVDGLLFFSAADGVNGAELWKSDGTAAGTVMVRNIRAGSASSSPFNLTAVGSVLYFGADDGSNGRELWKSDGTTAGTLLVENLSAGASNFLFSSTNNSIAAIDGQLFYLGSDLESGVELWKSDGTPAGTEQVTNGAAPASSRISQLTHLNGITLFVIDDSEGSSLWRTDGTAAGTSLLRAYPDGMSPPRDLVVYDNNVYFVAPGPSSSSALWRTDGTASGTSVVVPGGSFGVGSAPLTVFDGFLYFAASDGIHGAELWKSDGTEAGTGLVQDIAPGGASSTPTSLFVFEGWLYFHAGDGGPAGRELWRTDGSAMGAALVKDIHPGANSSSVGSFQDLGDVLVFFATDDTNGRELWRTDGTAAGTVLIKDVRPGTLGPGTEFRAVVGGTLYFAANDGTNGMELWKSDGTAAGTVLVKDISPGSVGTAIEHMVNVNGTLFFGLFRAGAVTSELWKSDGTSTGTQLVTDRVSGVSLANVNGTAWFAKADGANGYELWKSDGTLQGTQQIAELASPGGSLPQQFTVNGSTLFFTALTADTGRELWTIDLSSKTSAVLENAPIGTDLGLLSATDPDAGETFTYALVSGAGSTDNGVFSIAGSRLVTAGALDFETQAAYSIRVRATGADGLSVDQILTINAIDVDDLGVTSPADSNSAPNVIAENASNGATVGVTAFASDPDTPSNVVAYSLTNSAGGRFAINATTGIVTVANASLLNYEVAASHTITVRAASQDGSFSDQSFSINVADFDEFNVGEVTDSNPGANSILEHSAVGTPVGITALASDADGTNSGITYMLWDTRGGRFAINSVTGVVTVGNSELLDHATGPLWSIRVIAISQDGSFSFKDFTIAVTGNNPVSPVTDTNAAANAVADNAANGSTVGITAFASDADTTNNTVTYSLTNNAGGRFAINSTTGVVTVTNAALLATANQHTITVQAASSDGSTSTQSFTITVTSVDAFDVSAVTDTNAGANSILEHSPVGTAVGITAFAQDLDSSNNQITYMLWDTRGGRFAIDAVTGVVTVANSELLDRNTPLWSIRVLAISQDGSYSFKDFTIAVTSNAFNVSPVTDTNAAANVVAENAGNGSTVGITAFASDADTTNNTVTYSLTNSAGGRFAINSTTGVVTVANAALLASASQHSIAVQAASGDGSTSSQSFTIAVAALDAFDAGAITDANAAVNSVPEHSAVGTPVGITAFAQDLDSSNNQITYSLWDTRGGRFAINSVTGVVTVASSVLLDRATDPLWSIRVLAVSQDGSFSFVDFMIAIT